MLKKIHEIKLYQLQLLLILYAVPTISFSQIPQRAVTIADSICKTRLFCPSTKIELKDSTFYPKEISKYQNRIHETYFFQYKVYIKPDIISELNISINEDFSIGYVSGIPDSKYPYKICDILKLKVLRKNARSHGLVSVFRKCKYYLRYEENGIFIVFIPNFSFTNTNNYIIDALTNEFIRHEKMNVKY